MPHYCPDHCVRNINGHNDCDNNEERSEFFFYLVQPEPPLRCNYLVDSEYNEVHRLLAEADVQANVIYILMWTRFSIG